LINSHALGLVAAVLGVLVVHAGCREEGCHEHDAGVYLGGDERYEHGEEGDGEEDEHHIRYEQVCAQASAEALGANEARAGSVQGDDVGLKLLVELGVIEKGHAVRVVEGELGCPRVP